MRLSHVGQARQNRSRIASWAAYGRMCSTQDARHSTKGQASQKGRVHKAKLDRQNMCGGKAEALR